MPPRAKKPTKADQEVAEKAAMAGRIRATLVGWYPGKWAEEVNYGPACRCGLKQNPVRVTHGVDDGRCQRHGEAAGEDAAAAG